MRARIAGKVTSPGPRELRHQVERLERQPGRDVGRDRRGVRSHGRPPADRPGLHRARRRASPPPGSAPSPGPVAASRSRPRNPHRCSASTPRLARLARAAGGSVDDTDDAGPMRVDGRGPRWLRWVDGVAVVTDGRRCSPRPDRTRPRSGCSSRAARHSSSPTARSRPQRGRGRRRRGRVRRPRPPRPRDPGRPGPGLPRRPRARWPAGPRLRRRSTALLEAAFERRRGRRPARNSDTTQASGVHARQLRPHRNTVRAQREE